ncbi:MAG: DUF1592 domain-containing protein [Planctomycetaceae bacterium]|nr:DUF1592 domain-containing protein [Planctomycetaceae bacterium]
MLCLVPAAGLMATAEAEEKAVAAIGEQPLAPLQLFLKQHCGGCHSGGAAEGGFELSQAGPDLTDAETLRRWVRVHDRVRAGEMPPANEPRPREAAVSGFLASLSSTLTTADRQQREVVLRRLNRVEYENTLRDLFGIHVDVQGLLPEDASAGGFDNNGQALAISTELMQACLEAADLALDAAFGPEKEPKRVHLKFPLRQDVERHIGNLFRDTEEGVAMFHSGYSPSAFRTFMAREPGTYRARIQARGFQSDSPVMMQVEGGDVIVHHRPFRVVGWYALPPDRMTVVELKERLDKYDTFHPKPYGTPSGTREKHEYQGPGILIGEIEVEGPLEEWPPPSRKQLLGEIDLTTAGLPEAREILTRFVPRAFRRPADEATIAPYLALVQQSLEQGRPFEEALRLGLKAVLCSPEFLFLHEPPTDAGTLDSYALASRLSYFLWSSQPDAELLQSAADGTLQQPQVLRAQVERMLADERAAEFTANFTGQWLRLREINFTEPDGMLYPEYDTYLRYSMLEETRRFFNEILGQDLSLLNFVDSDWTILNERLAKHYDMPGITGPEFRRVELPPDSVRGGVLTQASVLKVTANGTNTSPVVRGTFVLENILGQPTPPPPPGVPAVEPDIRGATTIREQLAKHRNVESCASCHRQIDPPGFALESFDVAGGYRTWYRSLGEGKQVNLYLHPDSPVRVRYRQGPDVDSSGTTAGGTDFADIRDFRQLLLQNPDQIARCLTEKLLSYATGRSMGFSDRPAVEQIVTKVKQRNYGFRSLVHEVVQSELFHRP